MNLSRVFLAAIAAISMQMAWVGPAAATAFQHVIVQFDPTPDDASNGDDDRDDDSIDDTVTPIVDAITASIDGGPFTYGALGSVGPFGNLGIEGTLNLPGELDTQIFIRTTDIQNITGRAQAATANFIIDGGLAHMIAGAGSMIEFVLTIRKDFDVVYQTGFDYRSVPDSFFGTVNELELFGTDIGVATTSFNSLEIPLAFESADLGIIGANELFELSYQLDITATAVTYSEGMGFEFSDPLDVGGFGEYLTVTFSDPQVMPAPLSAPPSAPLFIGAFAAVALRRRWRQH